MEKLKIGVDVKSLFFYNKFTVISHTVWEIRKKLCVPG